MLSAMMLFSLSGCGGFVDEISNESYDDKSDDKSNEKSNANLNESSEETLENNPEEISEENSENTSDNTSKKISEINSIDDLDEILEETSEETLNEIVGDFRTEPNTPDEIAYVAYEKYLSSKNYTNCGHYNFEYIDSDEYPELLIEFPALGLSYQNGEVIELGDCLGDFFAYSKGTGYFLHMGAEVGTSTFEKITGGKTEVIAHSIKDYSDDSLVKFNYSFYVGEKNVSEEDYNNYISSLGEFEYLSEAPNARENIFDAYKSFKGMADDVTFSEDEAWKEAYYNCHEFYNEETMNYFITDANKDGVPEIVMEDVDGSCKFFYEDKFNNVNDLEWCGHIYEGKSGSIYTDNKSEQVMLNRTITKYDYYDEMSSWSANNQFEIILDDDWNKRIPGDYNYSDDRLYKDSEYCSYKVNGKDYSSYDEAANAFSQEFGSGDIQDINDYEGNYKSYNYNNFRQAILDYDLEIYSPLMYQVSRFEFADGKLNVVADTAPKMEDESLRGFEISFPLASDCKWYESFEGVVDELTTYDNICECQRESRKNYDTFDKEDFIMGEAVPQLIIKVKNGVIVEIYLNYVM